MSKYPKKTEYFSSFSQDFDHGAFPEKKTDGNYNYEKSSFSFRVLRFFLYRIIATPAALIYTRIILRDKVYGKEKLRKFKKQGYFIYANHTRAAADAFSPNTAIFPKRGHIIVSSKNLSIPVLGRLIPYLGAIPIPTERSAVRNFSRAIENKIKSSDAVIIYPEAHLWPFMKDLRPFDASSFIYPIRTAAPVFTLTRTYKKTKRGYRCELYIDGPFFPDASLCPGQAKEKLLEEVRSSMEHRCALSDIEVIRYEKRSDTE